MMSFNEWGRHSIEGQLAREPGGSYCDTKCSKCVLMLKSFITKANVLTSFPSWYDTTTDGTVSPKYFNLGIVTCLGIVQMNHKHVQAKQIPKKNLSNVGPFFLTSNLGTVRGHTNNLTINSFILNAWTTILSIFSMTAEQSEPHQATCI
jgi:hypothetical protein